MARRNTIDRLRERDGSLCHLCLHPLWFDCPKRKLDDLAPSIDHILPKSMGGTNTLKNLKLAHRVCNGGRKNIPVWEYKESLDSSYKGKIARLLRVMGAAEPKRHRKPQASPAARKRAQRLSADLGGRKCVTCCSRKRAAGTRYCHVCIGTGAKRRQNSRLRAISKRYEGVI